MNELEDFSSDTSDDDYIPDDESDDELVSKCNDELVEQDSRTRNGESGTKSLKRKKINGLEPRKRRGGIKLAEGGVEDDKEQIVSNEETPRDEETNKKKADDLWSSFMKDVEMKPKPKSMENESRNSVAKDNKEEKLVITKVYEFAGEEVRVTEEVNSCSDRSNNQQDEPNTSPSIGRVSQKGGISNILGKIGAKKKISTLEKSRLDWNQFKRAEGIEEEINTFNKGKEGYLERQAFLERSDLRQFEIERNLRVSNRSNR